VKDIFDEQSSSFISLLALIAIMTLVVLLARELF